MEITVFFVKAPLNELGKLALKLVQKQVPFSCNGTIEMRIEADAYWLPTLNKWFASIEKRCREMKLVFSLESYEIPCGVRKIL